MMQIDGLIFALGLVGAGVAVVRGAMPGLRPASEVAVLALALPFVGAGQERLLGLEPGVARAAIAIALARPIAAAAAASVTLAGTDALARYRRPFLGLGWLAFVARACTELAGDSPNESAAKDPFRALCTDVPAGAVVLADDEALFSRLLVARAVGALPPSTALFRWSGESPARLAAELVRDDSLRPLVRDLTLRGHVAPRTLLELARSRPVRTTAAAAWTPESAARLIPAGLLLRPTEEEAGDVAMARVATLDEAPIEALLAGLRQSVDPTDLIDTHRLLCSAAALFASSHRRDLAGHYCRVMAPDVAVVRCSVCLPEMRVSATDP